MSGWDGKRMVFYADKPWPNSSDWTQVDCYCCNGIAWGGDSPMECDMCAGNGWYARHEKTGTLALWPGGPLRGRVPTA